MLARLLATENISVVHENTPTAFFDLKARSLHLPLWSNASGSLYDMLVGHEVAHALWTDSAEWTAGIDTVASATGVSRNMAKSALNIVEDARIERMITAKFRGLRADFINGYRTLVERQFFGDISNINSKGLLDRVNIHFKCGVWSGARIAFSPREAALVDRIGALTEWGGVVQSAIDLIQCEQDRLHDEQEEQESNIPQAAAGTGEEDEQQTNPQGTKDSDEKQESGGGGKDGDAKPSDSDSDDQNVTAKPQEPQTGEERMMPTTQDSFDNAMKKFSEEGSEGIKEVIRVAMPDTMGEHEFVGYEAVLKDMSAHDSIRNAMTERVRVEDYTAATAAMTGAFNRRKAADTWRRTTVAKTGALCTLRMNGYKWNEDIFRRTTRVADGKNHGIVILLDWSGSMTGIMQSTIGQLFIITDFCRKANIPFEVLAFSDAVYSQRAKWTENDWEVIRKREIAREERNLVHTHSLTLFQFMSSRMNTAQYENMKSCLWNWRRMGCDPRYNLSGTPTCAALFALTGIVDEFIRRNRVQIAHTVVLTDGEPTDKIQFNFKKWATDNGKHACPYGQWEPPSRGYAVVLTDPRTGASYDLHRARKGPWNTDGSYTFGSVDFGNNTNRAMIAVDVLRRRTGCRVHWIGLIDRITMPGPIDGMVYDKGGEGTWKREGYVSGKCVGWDSATIVEATRFTRNYNGGVSDRMKKVLDKAEQKMENAKTDRALASAFIDSQIAKGSLRSLSNVIGEFLAVA